MDRCNMKSHCWVNSPSFAFSKQPDERQLQRSLQLTHSTVGSWDIIKPINQVSILLSCSILEPASTEQFRTSNTSINLVPVVFHFYPHHIALFNLPMLQVLKLYSYIIIETPSSSPNYMRN